MTMADIVSDWGADQWDVDRNAESLNKALFGKRTKATAKRIKPDADLRGRNGMDLGQDSGDEDNEKLSKKAKKKLKEKRRKENFKNKKNSRDKGNDADLLVDTGMDEKQKIKSQSPLNMSSGKKKGKLSDDAKSKVKTKDRKMQNGKRKFDESNDKKSVLKEKEKKRVKVVNDDNDEDDGVSKAKRAKTVKQNENSGVQEGEEETKKRKRNRKKKKKPSSKKNKYKHLDLLRNKSVSIDNGSGSESDQDGGRVKQKTNSLPPESNSTKPEKSKKRKRSPSPEMSVKKTKMPEKGDTGSPTKSKKTKKNSDVHLQAVGLEKEDEEKSKKQSKKKKRDKSVGEKGPLEKQIADSKTGNGQEEEVSESKKLKKEKKRKKSKDATDDSTKEESGETPSKDAISPFFSSQGMELQQKCMDKLISGRFRFINEQLYTINGSDAFRMFQQDKTLMEAYNTGFQSQVKQWSVNPLDVIIKQLSNKPANIKVADFGCGEARLSASVPQKVVHSLDLYALNTRVTVCNMAKTPLDSESVDIAVFCLSLMGINLNDYLLEANRVLKEGGILKVAEVVSRFSNLNNFISAVSSMGFKCVNSRDLSKMFYLMDFKKVKSVKKSSKQIKALTLSPCVYKKR